MKTIKDLKNYVKYHTRIVLKDLKDIKKEDNKNYLNFEEYSLIHSVLSDSVKAITESEKITEVLKKLYYISILDYKQLNIFENN